MAWFVQDPLAFGQVPQIDRAVVRDEGIGSRQDHRELLPAERDQWPGPGAGSGTDRDVRQAGQHSVVQVLAVRKLPQPDSDTAMPGSELADQRRQHPDRERADGGDFQFATFERLRLPSGQPGALGGGQHGACLGQDLTCPNHVEAVG